MRNLTIHPAPVLLLLLLLSGSVQPTSPLTESSGTPGLAAATIDTEPVAWCSLRCYEVSCPKDTHWAGVVGDFNEWDGGYHYFCADQPCGDPPWGRHPPCHPTQAAIDQIDQAVNQAQVDQLAEVLAVNELVVLNAERQAIQVWSACTEGQLSVHLPLPPDLFDALVVALQ